eukprot:2798867-Rhodomonas_salina.1
MPQRSPTTLPSICTSLLVLIDRAGCTSPASMSGAVQLEISKSVKESKLQPMSEVSGSASKGMQRISTRAESFIPGQ